MTASGNPDPSQGSGGARPRTTPSQEDAQFRQKLKHMGKCTSLLFFLNNLLFIMYYKELFSTNIIILLDCIISKLQCLRGYYNNTY